MPRFVSYTFAGIVLGLLVGVPWEYSVWRNRQYRNFHVVEDGVLYRSGQLPWEGLKRVIHDQRIKTIVTLRYAPSPDKPAPDQDEERECRAMGLHYFRLPYQPWTGPENDAADRAVPAEANIQQFLDIMKDPRNHPVLVHCFAGIHRTGAMCAVYRMEFDHWSPDQAMREMKELGYAAHHRDVFKYLENYQPRGYAFGKAGETRSMTPACIPDNVRPVHHQPQSNDESSFDMPRPANEPVRR